MTEKEKPKKNPILSLFRRKIENKNYEHDAAFNSSGSFRNYFRLTYFNCILGLGHSLVI